MQDYASYLEFKPAPPRKCSRPAFTSYNAHLGEVIRLRRRSQTEGEVPSPTRGELFAHAPGLDSRDVHLASFSAARLLENARYCLDWNISD
jgi:hypothetical protein